MITDDIREILRAGGTPKGSVAPLALSDEIPTYLLDQVAGLPWIDHLTLIAAVFTAQGMTRNTIFAMLCCLCPCFKTFFRPLDDDRKNTWNAESNVLFYLKGEFLPGDSISMRRTFWHRYKSVSHHLQNWLKTLPEDKQRRYRRYTLPILKLTDLDALMSEYAQRSQQQRLCVARAIATQPEVLLMDEPASALDPISTLRLEELILDLKLQYTIVIVTHNMQQAACASDYIVMMSMDEADRAGHVIEDGQTKQIFTNPHEAQTEAYMTGRFG